jgi:hypothetical protein
VSFFSVYFVLVEEDRENRGEIISFVSQSFSSVLLSFLPSVLLLFLNLSPLKWYNRIRALYFTLFEHVAVSWVTAWKLQLRLIDITTCIYFIKTIINYLHVSVLTQQCVLLSFLPKQILLPQDKQCTYNIILWLFRLMYRPPPLSQKSDAISLEDSAFMAI